MEMRGRDTRTVGAGAIATIGHSRLARWLLAFIIPIGMIAGSPQPALALDSAQSEQAGMAMVLLLSLAQALQQSKVATEPSDGAEPPTAQPEPPPVTAAVPDAAAVVDTTTTIAPTPLVPATPVAASLPDGR